MKIIESIFKNIEKVLRYLIPAFVFTILLKHFNKSVYEDYFDKLETTEFILYFTLLGIIIYSIHRTFFEFVDFLILKGRRKRVDITDAIVRLSMRDVNVKHYLYFKWAVIHSTLITTELIIFFIVINSLKYKCILIIAFALLIISLSVYIGYHNIEIKIDKVIEEKNKNK